MLAKVRPDLKLTFLDTEPAGLLVVRNLNPANRMLWTNYNALMRELLAKADEPVPEAVLRREGAINPTLDAIKAAIGP